MTARRQDLGSERDPIQAGNPCDIFVSVLTDSGHVGSLSPLDLTTVDSLEYAVFAYEGTQPVLPPLFVLSLAGDSISVSSAPSGQATIHLTQAHTALLTGRDWHACRYRDFDGKPYDIFDGYVVSTVALNFAVASP